MIERFEALLIAAGFRISASSVNGDIFTYRLEDDEEPEPIEVSINRSFVEDAPENGLAFVRLMFERRRPQQP